MHGRDHQAWVPRAKSLGWTKPVCAQGGATESSWSDAIELEHYRRASARFDRSGTDGWRAATISATGVEAERGRKRTAGDGRDSDGAGREGPCRRRSPQTRRRAPSADQLINVELVAIVVVPVGRPGPGVNSRPSLCRPLGQPAGLGKYLAASRYSYVRAAISISAITRHGDTFVRSSPVLA